MKCDCENVTCKIGHIPGACTGVPTVVASIFGHRQNLCSACYAYAVHIFGNKVGLLHDKRLK